jgi:NTE family protein
MARSAGKPTARPRKRRAAVRAVATPPVALALQGGGSHGAFTWGVLDALLEDGRIEFEAITGASSGAMNAVVLAEGWRRGLQDDGDPRTAARALLAEFWRGVGAQPSRFALAPALAWATPGGGGQNSATLMFDLMSRMFSPYQLNPFNFNPLRTLLKSLIDFDALRSAPPFKLFINATNVRSGRPRIFREHELKLEMVLASAAVPYAFHAVEVDGEHYWDGGYMGNPALYPLFYGTVTRDLLLVQINPLFRDEVPDTAQEIVERISEISFNSALLFELRAAAFVQRLLAERRLDPKHYKQVNMHLIDGEEALRQYTASSKDDTSPSFLQQLFRLGRTVALDWLERNIEHVGRSSSVQIIDRYL